MSAARRVPWTLAVAVVIGAALVAVPATRWIVAEQARLLVRPSSYMATLLVDLGVQELPGGVPLPRNARGDQAILRAAMRHPKDVGAQVVLASGEAGGGLGWDGTSERLLAVAGRFPGRPEVWAAVLRSMSGYLRMGREGEQDSLTAPARAYPAFTARPASPPEEWRRARDAARAGERCDPDNAFFPFMEAVAQLGLRDDLAAVSALHLAARCERWDDYVMTEAESRLRLQREAMGRRGVVPEVCVRAAQLMPHYAQMRAGARLLTFDAIEAERAGDRRGGLAIRHDLMRVAATQRAESRCELGAIVAAAMARVATARPGGAPARANPAAEGADSTASRQDAAYFRYLRGMGRQDEAAWASKQLLAGRDVRQIVTQALPASPDAGAPIRSLILKWIVGFGLAALACWSLVVGLLSRITAAGMSGSMRGWVVGFVAVALLAVFARTQTINARLYAAYPVVIDNLTASSATTSGPGAVSAALSSLLAGLAGLAMPGILIAVPLLTTGVAAIAARAQREPLLPTLGKALAAVGIVFLLADAWLVFSLADDEDRASAGLVQMLRHQGRYRADLVGRRWPPASPS